MRTPFRHKWFALVVGIGLLALAFLAIAKMMGAGEW
jgi:hypothetical protein